MSSTEEVELCGECDQPTADCACCDTCEKANCECCGTCDQYPCNCCDTCHYSNDYCECCGDCECYPCECDEECECGECETCGENGKMGTSSKPGWVSRGHKVTNVVYDDNWQETWPEIDADHFDPVVESANFYLLEAITGGVPNGIPERPISAHRSNTAKRDEELLIQLGVKSAKERAKRIKARDAAIEDRKTNDPDFALAVLLAEAEDMLETVVEKADTTLVGYFHMACAGEARHHRAIGGTVLAGGRSRAGAWIGWRKIYEAVGPESVKDLANLLAEITGGTYGGERWEEAANILYGRITGELGPTEAINKRLFVDRAWTLQHNGGIFLNKINWRVSNRKGWDLGAVQTKVLDAHASNPPNWKLLCSVADVKVVEMFHRHWEAMNARRAAYGMEAVENPVKNGKYRMMCRFCSSNPAHGHNMACQAPTHSEFNGGDISNPDSTPWILHIEEDEWNTMDWNNWHTNADKYAVSADGVLRLSAAMPVKVRASLSMTTDKHKGGNLVVDKTFDVSLEEAMNLDFTPKQLLKGKGTLGVIENFGLSVSVVAATDKLGKGNVHKTLASQYIEGYNVNKYPHYTPAFSNEEMVTWKSTPISVGGEIIKKLPHMIVRPATDEEKAEYADWKKGREKAKKELAARMAAEQKRHEQMKAARAEEMRKLEEEDIELRRLAHEGPKPMPTSYPKTAKINYQKIAPKYIIKPSTNTFTYVLSKPTV